MRLTRGRVHMAHIRLHVKKAMGDNTEEEKENFIPNDSEHLPRIPSLPKIVFPRLTGFSVRCYEFMGYHPILDQN